MNTMNGTGTRHITLTLIGVLGVFFTSIHGLVQTAEYVDRRRNAIIWGVAGDDTSFKNLTISQLSALKLHLAKEWLFGYMFAILLLIILIVISDLLFRHSQSDATDYTSNVFRLFGISLRTLSIFSLYLCLGVWFFGLVADGAHIVSVLF